jgi:hypothetical protein
MARHPARGEDKAVMEADTCAALAAARAAQGEEELMMGGDNAAKRLSIYGTLGGTQALTNSLWLCVEELFMSEFLVFYYIHTDNYRI